MASFKIQKQYRLRGYDYSNEGLYFITIVTKGREDYFGAIADNCMHFTPIGLFAAHLLQLFKPLETDADPFKKNPLLQTNPDKLLYIPEFTVMPNHVHLILGIASRSNPAAPPEPIASPDAHLRPLQKASVSSFINHYKGKVTRHATEIKALPFAWQPRFHDRIIRDADEYERIVAYIRSNVANCGRAMQRICAVSTA